MANLPVELWFNILEFIDDVDLFILSKVNTFFLNLVSDPLVWKKLKEQVHVPRLGVLLGKPENYRQDLVLQSISKRYGAVFLLSRQISSSYIDPNSLNSLEAQKSLNLKITSLKLNQCLSKRKSIDDIPFYHSKFVALQSLLEKQFAGIHLTKKLSERPSVVEISPKIRNERLVAQMICPGIRPMIRLFN